MTKLKVAMYAICKDEAQFVDAWMDSASEADVVVVTDTGSTDDTVEKLRSRGAQVYSIHVSPWRFDIARNCSLQLVPADVDVCVCTDLDERFEPGWRTKLERSWTKEATRLKYMFTWKFNSDGSRGPTFWKGKIHRRHGFRWVHPVHEVLYYYGDDPDVTVADPTIQLNHYPDVAKSRGQYLPLLELSVKEDPEYSDNVFYLGREYMYYGKWDRCIETLEAFLKLPGATWADQRSAAMRFIAKSYRMKRQREQAVRWLYRAIAEAPYLREPYVEMAKWAYEDKHWPKVYFMALEAAAITRKRPSYLTEASAWDHTIYDLGALASYRLGDYRTAYDFAKKALAAAPDNERLRINLERIRRMLPNEG